MLLKYSEAKDLWLDPSQPDHHVIVALPMPWTDESSNGSVCTRYSDDVTSVEFYHGMNVAVMTTPAGTDRRARLYLSPVQGMDQLFLIIGVETNFAGRPSFCYENEPGAVVLTFDRSKLNEPEELQIDEGTHLFDIVHVVKSKREPEPA